MTLTDDFMATENCFLRDILSLIDMEGYSIGNRLNKIFNEKLPNLDNVVKYE